MLGCLQGDSLYGVMAIWLLVSGFTGFLAMGIDKARAVGGEWRVPETTLFAIALVGGAFGVVGGMVVFHHKASKLGFLSVVLPVFVVWIVLLELAGFTSCLATYL